MVVQWSQQWSNSLDKSSLSVREYNNRMLFNSERGRFIQMHHPELICESKYQAELSRSREFGWKEIGRSDFFTSNALAQKCLIQFMDLIDRNNAGKVKRSEW